jgi:hypothetical protein
MENNSLVVGLIGIGLVLLGLAFVGGGIFSLIKARSFISKSSSAEGTVVSHRSGGGREYYAIVEYKPQGASSPVTFQDVHKGQIGFNVPGEGRKVQVAYDANNPENARINRGMNLYYAPLSLGITGIMLLCAGFAMTAYGIFDFTR